MFIIGLCFTFAPDEISQYLIGNPSEYFLLSIKFLGTFYIAFAVMNWMLKGTTFGGIYKRPAVLANLIHYMMVFFILLKRLLSAADFDSNIMILTLIYLSFTAAFAKTMMSDPLKA